MLNHAQIAERTAQIAAKKAMRRGGILMTSASGQSTVVTPAKPEPTTNAQIEPDIVYTKQRLFKMLAIGETTWAKWKTRGLRPFRVGKALAVTGAALIAVLTQK